MADRGGIQPDRTLTHYLLGRLKSFNDWGQCVVLHLMARYSPADEDEAVALLNLLDDGLKHNNPGVIFATVKLFVLLTRSLPQIKEDVYETIRGTLWAGIIVCLNMIGKLMPRVQTRS